MASQKPKPYTISWPFTPKTAEDIDQSFDILFKQVQLNAPGAGVLPVSLGGTGLGSFVKGDVLYASTASTIAGLNDIATGNVLLTGGVNTAPSYGKVGLTTHVSGVLQEANGGTNQSTYTQGDLIYASASNTLAKLAKDANATRYLSNTGASNAPAWAHVNLANGVTGTLPATNGGTGQATYAVGDLLYASTTSALSRLADIATGNALISGGVNTAPSWGKIADAHISDVTEAKITDGTILARVAANETITGDWTISSSAPLLKFLESDAAANAQKWRLNVDGGQFAIQVLSDNEITVNSPLIIVRSGSTVSSVTTAFPWSFAGAVTLTSTISVAGVIAGTAAGDTINVRPNSGNAGYIKWTENAVADYWALGTNAGDGTLYLRSTNSTGTARQTWTTSAANFAINALPSADNTYNCGNASFRWALVRGVTITPGDLLFENGWVITESDKYGIATPGLVILDENDDLVIFIGDSGNIYANVLPLLLMPAYTKTTLEERTGHSRP